MLKRKIVSVFFSHHIDSAQIRGQRVDVSMCCKIGYRGLRIVHCEESTNTTDVFNSSRTSDRSGVGFAGECGGGERG